MMKDEQYLPHAILLPGNCLVAVAVTKAIAEDYANATYGGRPYTIVLATKRHIAELGETK